MPDSFSSKPPKLKLNQANVQWSCCTFTFAIKLCFEVIAVCHQIGKDSPSNFSKFGSDKDLLRWHSHLLYSSRQLLIFQQTTLAFLAGQFPSENLVSP